MKTIDEYGISALLGQTITKIQGLEKSSDVVLFFMSNGDVYKMHHDQDCCETVEIDDVVGDVNDLLNTPILVADENTSDENTRDIDAESFTWTFYKLATKNGYVDIKWWGESNGYYSENVDFEKIGVECTYDEWLQISNHRKDLGIYE